LGGDSRRSYGDVVFEATNADDEAQALLQTLALAIVDEPELALEEPGPVCAHTGDAQLPVEEGGVVARAKGVGCSAPGFCHDVNGPDINLNFPDDHVDSSRDRP
jgi:hypothetical protein